MSLAAMTAHATQEVAAAGGTWLWMLRGGCRDRLAVEIALPPGCEGLDPPARDMIRAAMRRGQVEAVLHPPAAARAVLPGPQELAQLFAAIAALEMAAMKSGVQLARTGVADILNGSLGGPAPRPRPPAEADRQKLLGGLRAALAVFGGQRRAEGRGLERKICIQLDQVETLAREARALDRRRGLYLADQFAVAVRRVLSQAPGLDPGRLEQELAALAARADVAGELDRLEAHAAAIRAILQDPQPAGARLALLAEELARETGRLREKAHFLELTRLGLDLQTAIDQLRGHIDNVE
ncbi:endoribonuclease YicC domain-containing protein [Mangrovicoccus algicola]|uniref:DUF1732 domain-containing protein n=1 Tax=Mangrovicoccus algicola TaxID=2771008 RepID=A0A8J7CVD5_9RHOB|nr:DUF1732 domain-containing protein [Mangrovicoccus algicola]MBE3638609.1 DUF1732 domain-containing protein [Mangrovicoccus algicola]